MATDTITHETVLQLVEAGAIRAAHVVGQKGGWGVLFKYGMTERPLAAQRGNVRVFKRLYYAQTEKVAKIRVKQTTPTKRTMERREDALTRASSSEAWTS